MAKRPTLTDLTSLTNSSAINTLSQNWDAIQTAFDNTLSLDGSTPNAMNSDIDLNGNSLLNVDTLDVDGLTLNGQTVTGLATVPQWRNAWASGQGYIVNDLVKTAGNVYICLVAHTAGGDFSADLTAGNWELFVPKGDSGSGTGDLVSTNNLSDVANPATSRTNLGLGTVAVENTVPVSKGGTGATDAATARTNLGVQAAGATLSSLEGLSLVSGDVLYATAADTLARLPKGTDGQILTLASGLPSWSSTSETWTTMTSTSCNSGTSAEKTGIPVTATKIIIVLTSISTDSTGDAIVRLFESGVIKATGYKNQTAFAYGAGNTYTTGFGLRIGTAARAISGYVTLTKNPAVTNLWEVSTNVLEDASLSYVSSVGYVTAANVDGIRIVTSTGNFDGSGSFVVVHNG